MKLNDLLFNFHSLTANKNKISHHKKYRERNMEKIECPICSTKSGLNVIVWDNSVQSLKSVSGIIIGGCNSLIFH